MNGLGLFFSPLRSYNFRFVYSHILGCVSSGCFHEVELFSWGFCSFVRLPVSAEFVEEWVLCV